MLDAAEEDLGGQAGGGEFAAGGCLLEELSGLVTEGLGVGEDGGQGGQSDAWDQRLARVAARTIPVLPPRRQIEWHFAFGPKLFDNSDLPRQYVVTVNATGPYGPAEPLAYVLDLDAIDASALERGTVEASLAKIADHAKELAKLPREISSVARAIHAARED